MIPLRTVTGKVLDLALVQPSDLDLESIVRGQAHAPRFSGQLPAFYSVAQHAILVADILTDRGAGGLRLHALTHDGAEAFVGDMPRNLKHSPLLEGFRHVEAHVQQAVDRFFQLRPLTEKERRRLKAADDLAFSFEQATLQTQHPWTPNDLYRHLQDGAVSSDAVLLMSLADRLPSKWPAWPCEHAYTIYRRELIHAVAIRNSLGATRN